MTNGRIRRRIVAGVVAFVLLNIALAAANEFLPSGRIDGDPGSSFVTTPEGTAAWFELLQRTGGEPERLTAPLSDISLDPSDALVVIDVAIMDDASASAVVSFVRNGGRVVVAVPDGLRGDLADALLADRPLTLTDAPSTTFAVAEGAPLPAGVTDVETDGTQAIEAPDGTTPLLVDETGRALAFEYELGAGTVVMVGDSSVFSNRNLATADNAALAVAILDGRHAAFDEYSHGFLSDLVSEPLLPRSWRWTLYLMAAALIVFLVAAGRRLGPPEPATRALPPPRRWFVESLATTLARTDVGEATDPLRHAAARRLAARAGLRADAGPAELQAAGIAHGIPPEDLAALFRPAASDEDALAIGRVMARAGRSVPPGAGPDRGAIVPDGSPEEGMS